jgi:hypothetical protein
MARRFFTAAEVERLIPNLEAIFTRALQLRAALHAQEKHLEQAGVSLSREALEKEDPREPPDIRRAKAMFRGYYEALADELSAIAKLGGEVKDLDTGLVDFPARRGEEEVLLCWKLGEKKIAFWHTTDSGFAGRRPLDEQMPRGPRPLD